MPNKSFSVYSSENSAADATEALVLEVAKTHLAFISRNKKNIISAFELFTFSENEAANFPELLTAVAVNSKIFTKTFSSAEIFINNEVCLPVPIFHFNREIAADYLDIMFGEDADCIIQFEHLPVEQGMMNVYRIEEQLSKVLHNHSANITFKHTWSNILKTVLSGTSALSDEFLYIQFYNTFIVVAVIKDKMLQIIQSFTYEIPEDVLYYLLNITGHFTLNRHQLTLQISGMIDLNFTMYRELITYFKNVEVRNVNATKVTADIKEFPLHYFTPFFNLAT